jgi:hypothetical protein
MQHPLLAYGSSANLPSTIHPDGKPVNDLVDLLEPLVLGFFLHAYVVQVYAYSESLHKTKKEYVWIFICFRLYL